MITIAKGKYEYWITDDGLLLLAAWARDGLTDEDIAKRCGVARSTLSKWKIDFQDISDALKKGKELVDIEVENALHMRAIGYTIPLQKTFKVKRTEYDEDTGRKVSESEELVTGIDEVHIPADVTAQIYWLNNRQRSKWQARPVPDADSDLLKKAKELLGGVESGF